MAKVSTYLNFVRNTEAAFQFYKSVFKTEFIGPIMRASVTAPDARTSRRLPKPTKIW
jgi:PhnB protein